MMSSHSITIEGFVTPKSFVEKWRQAYDNYDEQRYIDNIDHVLENWESFRELFAWKNGMGDKIAPQKLKLVEGFWDKKDVLKNLQHQFSWDVFEQVFKPSTTSNIWKLFLLHIIDPFNFPIFDQHVYRFYTFHKAGVIEEIPKNHKVRYLCYKEDYIHWFRDIRDRHKMNPKAMDEAFFSYGKMLKSLDTKRLNIKEVNA